MCACTLRTRAAAASAVGGVAVGGGEHEVGRALEAAPRVFAELAVLVDRGHRPRLERLHEQRAQAADEHHRIGVDAPRDAVGPEDPCVAAHAVQATRRALRSWTVRITSPTCVASATSMPVDDVAEEVVVLGELAGAVVDATKNCEPLVFGPALAIATAPSVYSPCTGSSSHL